MIDINKRLLTDTVTIQKVGEVDGWGKVSTESPITLKSVRFDRRTLVQGTKNERQESKPSTLFIYPKHCPIELDESFYNAVVNDGNHDYIVKSITPVGYPHKDKIFCYEVECI